MQPGDYLEILEHLLSVMADKLLDKQELSRSREPHQLRKILRRGKYPERYLARGVVLFAYRYADVYLAALEERHRVLFVYNSGEQQRLYLAGENARKYASSSGERSLTARCSTP